MRQHSASGETYGIGWGLDCMPAEYLAAEAVAVGADFYQADSIMTCLGSYTCGAGYNEESGLIVNNVGQRVVDEWTYF